MAEERGKAASGGLPALVAGRLPAEGWVERAREGARGALVSGLAREAEQRRLFPWLAVAFGLGILAYFHLTQGEPVLAAPLAAAGLCAGTAVLLRAHPVGLAVALGLGFAFLGFAAATYRVAAVASPVLPRTMIAPLVGLVEALDEREGGARLIVQVERFGTLEPAARPARVRVSYKGVAKGVTLRPGDTVAATARLLPPPEAARPGGYDFARDAYFRGIGAVGSLVGKVEVRPPAAALPLGVRIAAAVDGARNALTRRITDANGGQAGAVAAALVTGKRGLIGDATNDVLRAAGIYHVVSK